VQPAGWLVEQAGPRNPLQLSQNLQGAGLEGVGGTALVYRSKELTKGKGACWLRIQRAGPFVRLDGEQRARLLGTFGSKSGLSLTHLYVIC